MNDSANIQDLNTVIKTKRCSTCKEHLLVYLFSKNKAMKDGYQNVCKSCKAPINKQWWDKAHQSAHAKAVDCSRVKSAALLRTMKKYNVTWERYEEMTAAGCGICGGPPCGRGRYHFDHDHKTGRFRGLLCHFCNIGLGLIKDDLALVDNMIDYLQNNWSTGKRPDIESAATSPIGGGQDGK